MKFKVRVEGVRITLAALACSIGPQLKRSC